VSYRCINAFEFDGVIYPGGMLVADGAPIVASHRQHFAHVDVPRLAVETATAGPGERRDAPTHAPAKAAKRPAHKSVKSEVKLEEES